MLEARSDPRAMGTHLEATSPASPPLLPPQLLSGLCGFYAVPQILFAVCVDAEH